MPRYYFHIFNGETTIDEEGAEFVDLDAARESALEAARDMVCEAVREGHLNLDHRIEITDEDNGPLMTVTFREAFTIQG